MSAGWTGRAEMQSCHRRDRKDPPSCTDMIRRALRSRCRVDAAAAARAGELLKKRRRECSIARGQHRHDRHYGERRDSTCRAGVRALRHSRAHRFMKAVRGSDYVNRNRYDRDGRQPARANGTMATGTSRGRDHVVRRAAQARELPGSTALVAVGTASGERQDTPRTGIRGGYPTLAAGRASAGCIDGAPIHRRISARSSSSQARPLYIVQRHLPRRTRSRVRRNPQRAPAQWPSP